MLDTEKIRKDFPVTKKAVYFQSAGMSPLPAPVFKKIKQLYGGLHKSGDINFLHALAETEILKARLGKMLNTGQENICFVPNNSFAMSLIALAMKKNISGNFNIISMDDEFPSTTVPYEYQQIQIKYVSPRDYAYPVENILHLIDNDTIAVVTSYVQYATGFRQNLKELGEALKKRNILFIVNATQGFPLFPVNVKDSFIDALTCSVHKWGFAGHTGTIFFTTPEFRKRFPNPLAGWLSVVPKGSDFIHTEKNAGLVLHESAGQYCLGTYNLHTLIAFGTAVGYINKLGADNITAHLFMLTDYLIARLKEYNIQIISPVSCYAERSAIISITLGKENNNALLKFLESGSIFVAQRMDFIRISINIFNNESDVNKLLNALVEFRSKLRAR